MRQFASGTFSFQGVLLDRRCTHSLINLSSHDIRRFWRLVKTFSCFIVSLFNNAHAFFRAKNSQSIAIIFPKLCIESRDQFSVVYLSASLYGHGRWNTTTGSIDGLVSLKDIESRTQTTGFLYMCRWVRLRSQRGGPKMLRGTPITELSRKLYENLRS